MNFLTKDEDLLKKYHHILNKVSDSIKRKNLIANPSTIRHFENQNKVLQ